MSFRKQKCPGRHSALLREGEPHALVQLFSLLKERLGLSEVFQGSNPRELVFNPEMDYTPTDSLRFADKYLVQEFLSKFPFEVEGVDRKAVALSAFEEAEGQCSLTNSTVRVNTCEPLTGITWHAVVETARLKVLHLLGPFSWDRVEVHCSHGPGATTSKTRSRADAFYKFGDKPDVTPDCALLAWIAVYRQPAWFESLTNSRPTGVWLEDYWRFPPESIFNLVPGSKVTSVPKNAKTERIIAIEPDLNMYLQKGIGCVIRSCLRKVGINLNDQTQNQRLAKLGSLNGDLATVDFKAASDTISREIVELLLPSDWLVALKQTRSPTGILPSGRIIQFEKFSSMGNGYTFELESLIFWALARSVCDLQREFGVVSVYGDDLIVPGRTESSMRWAFSRAGFTLNEKKSFFAGPFRESCGKHYFRGDDVSPFYVKRPLRTVWDLYTLANNIRRWSRCSWGLDPRLQDIYDVVVEAIPPYLRVRIPDGIGDVGLIGDFDEAVPRFNRDCQSYSVRVFLPSTDHKAVNGLPLMSKWFHLRGKEPVETRVGEIPIVDPSYGQWRIILVKQWPNFGPWLTTD